MDSTSIPFRSHTALLLAVALPHLQPAYRHPAELALKFLELSETMKLYREFHLPKADSPSPLHKHSSTSPGLDRIMDMVYRFVQDPEGLLHSLSAVCTGKEKDIVSTLLNLMQAKSFYENYGDILKTFMSSDMSSDFSDTPPTDIHSTDSFPMPDLTSLMADGDLTSLLSKDQTDTLNLLKNLLDEE